MKYSAQVIVATLLAVIAIAPCRARAQQADSQHAAPFAGPPDTIRAGMRVRLFMSRVNLVGTIVTLNADSLILQEIQGDQPVQTTVPLVCVQGAERGLQAKTRKASAKDAFWVGAVIGLAAGIIVNNQRGGSKPPTPPVYLLGWSVGGGAIAAGTAALIAGGGTKWVPASLPPIPSVSFELRTALCKRWTATE
jgi:hypothetical protein